MPVEIINPTITGLIKDKIDWTIFSLNKFLTNAAINIIIIKDGKIAGVKIKNGEIIECDSCIIATGGKSYPGTGSTGDGYRFAEEFDDDFTLSSILED